MKIFLLSFLFISGLISAQMPNIEQVWLNDSSPYVGTLQVGEKAVPLKLQITLSEQNRKNDQQYFISGNLILGDQTSKVEGTFDVKKYKDKKKGGTVFGEYEIAQEPTAKLAGIYKGKFSFKFEWNSKLEQIEKKDIEFTGTWTRYNDKTSYKTQWKNE